MRLEARYLNEINEISEMSIWFTSYCDIAFTLIDDDKIVAIATADNFTDLDELADADYIEIHNLGVVEQGKGYGSTLVRLLQERFDWLEAHEILESATGFWEKMGFEIDRDAEIGTWYG
jgi:N-acetylglutamate synthase-like GNAT family acetyltransferase